MRDLSRSLADSKTDNINAENIRISGGSVDQEALAAAVAKRGMESAHILLALMLLTDIDVMTSKRYDAFMSIPKRATVYFEPEIHRALRLKAAATDRSISDMVNDAVKLALAEDAEDLAAFEERAHEKSVDFETVVRSLRRRGKI
jgi:plasmid stability protein